MRAAARILRGAAVVLLACVILVNLALLAARFVLRRDPPHILGFYPMVVTTGSMEPTLPAGSVVLVHAQGDYEVGDIISFRREGAVVTHRIMEKAEGGFRTAGEANNVADSGTVAPEDVLGRVILCLPWLGRLILALRGPVGILALAAGGGILLFLPDKGGKEKHEDTEKTA